MASTSFGSQKKLAGKVYRDGPTAQADADVRKDIDAAFVAHEIVTAASTAALAKIKAGIAATTNGAPTVVVTKDTTGWSTFFTGAGAAFLAAQPPTIVSYMEDPGPVTVASAVYTNAGGNAVLTITLSGNAVNVKKLAIFVDAR